MEPELRVRLNQLDWTLETPGHFDNAPSFIDQVPVIRIFGPSSDGIQACVHIHQVYPYFYVDYNDSLEPDVGELTRMLRFVLSKPLTSPPKHPRHQLLPQPAARSLPETRQSRRADASLHTKDHSRQRRKVLWIQQQLLAVPQGVSCRS
jgi:hypothetical protein